MILQPWLLVSWRNILVSPLLIAASQKFLLYMKLYNSASSNVVGRVQIQISPEANMLNIHWTVICKPWTRFIRCKIGLLESVTFHVLLRMLCFFPALNESYEHLNFSVLGVGIRHRHVETCYFFWVK